MDNDETFDVIEVVLEVQFELMNDFDHLFQLFLLLFANLQTRLEHCSVLLFPWMADEPRELARVPLWRNTEVDRSCFIHCEDNGWNNPSLSSGSS